MGIAIVTPIQEMTKVIAANRVLRAKREEMEDAFAAGTLKVENEPFSPEDLS